MPAEAVMVSRPAEAPGEWTIGRISYCAGERPWDLPGSGKLRPSVRPGTLPHFVVQPDDVRNAIGDADVLGLAAAGMLDPGIGVSHIVEDTAVEGDHPERPR